MLVLHLLHLIFGTIWLGAGFYYNFVLLSSLRRMDAGTHRAVNTAVTRVMGPLLGVSALITVASGAVMLARLRPEHGCDLLASGWGRAMRVGVVTTIVALVVVFAVELPAERKLDRLAAAGGGEPGGRESAEVRRLADRAVFLGRLATALLFVALASMAVARYV